tara:strand:+ start:228 stop:581 length:354 start_codon:yes stop_codon:yes gene_type:complete
MKIKKIERKKFRVRNKVKKVSSEERFRLSVNRSSRNISVQIIDDKNNLTLVSASSSSKEIKAQKKNKKELSTLVAEELAQKAKEKKITKVYFDRGVYKYHGRVKLLAEQLRKNGMEF